MKSEQIIEIGIAFLGFLASSPVVAIQSKPTNPKKHVAAPFKVPENPKGKKPPFPPLAEGSNSQFSILTEKKLLFK